MVDMPAIASAASALKTAYDLSKAAMGAHDAGAIRAKVTEMQGEISSALASAITAQTDQMAMLKRVGDLEKEIADLKAWDTEKARYELVSLAPHVNAYAIKAQMSSGEPPHYLCANCYTDGKKSFLQATVRGQYHDRYHCRRCGEELNINKGTPRVHHSPPRDGGPNS